MKFFVLMFALIFSSPVFADISCTHGDYKSLVEAWIEFQRISLNGTPEEIAKFYKFPLKLRGPMDDDSPILVGRNVFLERYESIFEQIVDGVDTELYVELKKIKSSKYVQLSQFDQSGCFNFVRNSTDVSYYEFSWNKKNGWLIEAVSVGPDYSLLVYLKKLKR